MGLIKTLISWRNRYQKGGDDIHVGYLISFNEIDENVFEDRKIALKRIHNAEQKYPQVSGETYYEEY